MEFFEEFARYDCEPKADVLCLSLIWLKVVVVVVQ